MKWQKLSIHMPKETAREDSTSITVMVFVSMFLDSHMVKVKTDKPYHKEVIS